jgi:hypothetical protein
VQAICDNLGPGEVDALLRKWLAILPHPFTAADRAAGYRYDVSILQAEFSLTQMLDKPVSGRVFFEQVIRDNLDIGRPDQVGLVFDRRIFRGGKHPTPGRFRTRVKLAGRSDTLFSDDAIALIHQVSRGIPRAVNNLAVQALVAAFTTGKAIVDESSARAAVTEVTTE